MTAANPASERYAARFDVVRSAHGIVNHSIPGHEKLLWTEVQYMKKAIARYEAAEDGGNLSSIGIDSPFKFQNDPVHALGDLTLNPTVDFLESKEERPDGFLCAMCFKHISPDDQYTRIPPNYYHEDCVSHLVAPST